MARGFDTKERAMRWMKFWAIVGIAASAALAGAQSPDTPFPQQTAAHYAFPDGVTRPLCVHALPDGSAQVGTQDGVWTLSPEGAWSSPAEHPLGAVPVFAIGDDGKAGRRMTTYYATMNGVAEVRGGAASMLLDTPAPAAALAADDGVVRFAGAQFTGSVAKKKTTLDKLPEMSRGVRAMLQDGGTTYIATSKGLYAWDGAAGRLYQSPDEILAADVYGLALDPQGRLWAGGLGGVTLYERGEKLREVRAADGIPNAWVGSVARGPRGEMWVGTAAGISIFKADGTHTVRHSRRWLLNDEVIALSPAPSGYAMWVLTPAGLSKISEAPLTLAAKADYFDVVTEERHVRPPGFVEKIVLHEPHSLASWRPEDDDNDGEYTSQYLSAQAFRYAATGSKDALEKARRSWKALTFLGEVSGLGGFIARTVIPPDWDHMHDPNLTYNDNERAVLSVVEPRFKPVEERWHLSADGAWRWKGDTSSDEYTGHYYAFVVYYDLIATEEEKPAVRAYVAKVTDYLIEGGYDLRDIDGQPTRWGVWSPDKINNDPDWRAERGINSAELLAYLLTAWHITGDDKYRGHYDKLVTEHHYAENARRAKVFDPAWITHIDDCLLVMVYRPLLTYEKDPALAAIYRESFDHWYEGIRHEQNPWFNFSYAGLTGTEAQQEDSLFFLRDTPLDLISYSIDNRQREDLSIVRRPILEDLQTNRILPPSERATVRWDKNPYQALAGESGHTEWAPTFWLMAYWMGRYHGLIAE